MKLAEYASKTDRTTRCITCNLPPDVLDQIHAAREGDERISFPIISKWLKQEFDLDILHTTIRNHFTAEHERD